MSGTIDTSSNYLVVYAETGETLVILRGLHAAPIWP